MAGRGHSLLIWGTLASWGRLGLGHGESHATGCRICGVPLHSCQSQPAKWSVRGVWEHFQEGRKDGHVCQRQAPASALKGHHKLPKPVSHMLGLWPSIQSLNAVMSSGPIGDTRDARGMPLANGRGQSLSLWPQGDVGARETMQQPGLPPCGLHARPLPCLPASLPCVTVPFSCSGEKWAWVCVSAMTEQKL